MPRTPFMKKRGKGHRAEILSQEDVLLSYQPRRSMIVLYKEGESHESRHCYRSV